MHHRNNTHTTDTKAVNMTSSFETDQLLASSTATATATSTASTCTTSSNNDIESLSHTKSNDRLPISVSSYNDSNQHQRAFKLVFAACGIYSAFLYYGTLQEDVFHHVDRRSVSDVDVEEENQQITFKHAWMLMVIEAFANVVVGYVGMVVSGGMTRGLPKKQFAITGATQVSAKAFTSLALANGLSFPVATLAKSGKMAPVMVGSLFLGGATYSFREYAQVVLVISGTAIVSMGKKKSTSSTSPSSGLGIMFICLSLAMDGITAGVQKRLKREATETGAKPKSYDFMFWTNLYMMLTGFIVSTVIGDFSSGLVYCSENPDIWALIIKLCLCSALGQSFIFFTIANFDPLVCTTVTTTRKIFSVLLSIFLKGHQLSTIGWGGIIIAVSGIVCEVHGKCTSRKRKS